MWHQWLNFNFAKLLECFLCEKKTKISTYSTIFLPDLPSSAKQNCWMKSLFLFKVVIHTLYITFEAAVGKFNLTGERLDWTFCWYESYHFDFSHVPMVTHCFYSFQSHEMPWRAKHLQNCRTGCHISIVSSHKYSDHISKEENQRYVSKLQVLGMHLRSTSFSRNT